MKILKRLFSLGKAEANSAIDNLEDPIKMTEQGIRDLKADLEKSLQGLAEIKSLAIRARNDMETAQNRAKDYENKAMMLLKRAQKGEMSSDEADRLANEALTRKEEAMEEYNRNKADKAKFDDNVSKMETKIKQLRSKISTYENELRTLKARVKVSSATKNINKQMANVDTSGTVSMLERMKEKVSEEEALSESYADIANESRSVDEEIDQALGDQNKGKASDELAEMKKRLGMRGDSDDSKKE